MMLIYLIILAASLLYLYVKRKYKYWENVGVPFIKPKFPFGNIQGFGRRVHSSQLMQRFYKEMKGKHPFGGIFFFHNPVALILDLDLVKNVLVKDFQYFHDRGVYYNEKDDPISGHLFNIEGEKWTNLRKKLTPTFTTGKIKMMFSTITEVGDRFVECLAKETSGNSEIEIKDILGRFTTDIIGSCAFGLDCNSLNDPDNKFREMGKKAFEMPRRMMFKFFFLVSFKKLAKFFRLKGTREEISSFYLNVVDETIKYREENNVQRNDFMNLLMQLKNTGTLEDSKDDIGKLTFNEIAAQAFVFFLAGFETSSTTMMYCLYELSLNQDIQEKARKCVRDNVEKHGGLIYEAIMDMHYIDQCINESLRKYPPGANLLRQLTKEYKVPGTNNILPKGMAVWIPVYALQHDPEYYPDPEKFDPDRFSPEEVAKRNPYTFLAFGEGPRNCIGLRFGMMQTRIGLAVLLMNFRFKSCSKSVIPLVISTKNAILSPEGGLWLNVQKLE